MTSAAPADATGGEISAVAGHNARLGLPAGTALYIASVLGSGVLVLPGLAAAAAGPGSVLAVGIIFVLSIPLAATFAALAARYPDPGGVASYVRRTMGNVAARATGYWFYIGVALGIPVLMVLGAEYSAAVLELPRAIVPWLALVIFAVPFTVNWFGVAVAGWVQFVLTGLLLAVVISVGAVALPQSDPANFDPFLPFGLSGVGTAVSLFVWAFAGWEVGTHIAAEFKNPRRVIPIATAIALVVVGVSYFVLQMVTIGVLGADHEWGLVPLLDLASAVAPGLGPWLVGVVALIVTVGVINAYLPALGKLGAALAEKGDLPRALAPGAAPGETPRPALIVTAVIALAYFAVMAATGNRLDQFILFHTANMVAIYAAGMVAALLLLPRFSLGWWLAAIATAMSAVLLVLAGWYLVAPGVLAALAVIVELVRRRKSSS